MIATEPEVTIQSGVPIHRQIADQIRSQISAGVLLPGEELPSPRALAVGLAVNVKAVARAYRRLEREGYVSTADNSGIFVAGPCPTAVHARRGRSRLERSCARLLDRAERAGFSAEETLHALHVLIQRRSQS
jgi:DNA-binding transcriptional regulator YhcF (GntR family)